MLSCSKGGSNSTQNVSGSFRQERLEDGRYKVLVEGEAMGTTYHITTIDTRAINYGPAVDSLLAEFNACLSTYDSNSALSQWNRSADGWTFSGDCAGWMHCLLTQSLTMYRLSEGAFDPSVMPLVRYWGFFKEDPFAGASKPDSLLIEELVGCTGFPEVLAWSNPSDSSGASATLRLEKRIPCAELDFNAVAKGYGVDLVANLLREKGLTDFLVEIGGEVVASGRNDRGKPWSLAIERPDEAQRVIQSVVGLDHAALATSGNYRRYWERDGQKYGHTLNPKTGYPERSALLSATVLAPTCDAADALATTCMVVGLERALGLIEELEDCEVYLLYLDEQGEIAAVQSSGFGEATFVETEK